ncbi:MAG: DUF1553 domain-containing protein [Bryobacteraceae bacterium]
MPLRRWLSAVALTAGAVLAGIPAGAPVQVEIFEDLPAGSELAPTSAQPAERYTEPAFGFVQIPRKFSMSAAPLDRSTPFVLRATYEQSLPAGTYQFRLRARGAARFSVDGKSLWQTKAQPPNTSGDDPVPPPVERNHSPLRPAPYPHQDAVGTIELSEGKHQFLLVAVIGGKGLFPSPGELAVSFGRPGQMERLLGPDGSPELTDKDWEAYVTAHSSRHETADVARRRAVSQPVVAAWKERHAKVRALLEAKAAPRVPETKLPVHNEIDRFLGAKLEAASSQPQPLTSDLEFLRRVSLDATGLIPTSAEVKSLLADPVSTRRKKAVERLLADPSWADSWVSYWQDVLAENPGILKPDLNNTGPFRWWLHQSFSDNLPFDRLAAELVEMEGSLVYGAPAAFAQATLNDAPMAAKADIISQAFLAQKMGCARCHDAPFHPFKQKDLFSLAAMLDGKPLKLPATSTVPMVEGARKPVVPVTLKPGELIEPEWPFKNLTDHADTGSLPASGSVPTRRALAAMIVSPQNERFAQVIVNRVWKRYMGVALVEPVDDWARSKASHPDLLEYLGREFMRNGYDMKHLARLIFSSHAYQRKPDPALSEQTASKDRLFSGPARRKMTAEQLVDSLHRSVGKAFQCEELNLNPAGDRSPKQFLNMGKPERAWQLTALSNERDRPALALPIAQSLIDVMSAYGWRQSRQNPATTRDDAPSPMQTLVLANGILGTRIARLSDDSEITTLCLRELPLKELIHETFLRVLSRPPSIEEGRMFDELLRSVYATRKVEGAAAIMTAAKTDSRVSWSNHLSAEATLIRMEEERRLRMGDEPTRRLTKDFRERFEDALWAMLNSPEYVVLP